MRNRNRASAVAKVAKRGLARPKPILDWLPGWPFDWFLDDWRRLGWNDELWGGGPLVSIKYSCAEGKYLVRADLSSLGEDPEVRITVTKRGWVNISAKAEQGETKQSWSYAFGLPKGIDESTLKAELKNGILEVSAPLPEELKAREVPVKVVKDSEEGE